MIEGAEDLAVYSVQGTVHVGCPAAKDVGFAIWSVQSQALLSYPKQAIDCNDTGERFDIFGGLREVVQNWGCVTPEPKFQNQ